MRDYQFCEFLTQPEETEFKCELQLGELRLRGRGRVVLGKDHGFIRLVCEGYEGVEDHNVTGGDLLRKAKGEDTKCGHE